MNRKVFSERFNRKLSLLDFPDDLQEKVKAVAEVFGVNRYLANAMIFGNAIPTEDVLDNIARILEVCPQWLGGKTDRKKFYVYKESIEQEQE